MKVSSVAMLMVVYLIHLKPARGAKNVKAIICDHKKKANESGRIVFVDDKYQTWLAQFGELHDPRVTLQKSTETTFGDIEAKSKGLPDGKFTRAVIARNAWSFEVTSQDKYYPETESTKVYMALNFRSNEFITYDMPRIGADPVCHSSFFMIDMFTCSFYTWGYFLQYFRNKSYVTNIFGDWLLYWDGYRDPRSCDYISYESLYYTQYNAPVGFKLEVQNTSSKNSLPAFAIITHYKKSRPFGVVIDQDGITRDEYYVADLVRASRLLLKTNEKLKHSFV